LHWLAFVLLGCGASQSPTQAAANAPAPVDNTRSGLARLAKATWLFPADDCPADVLAEDENGGRDSLASCTASLDACVVRCQSAKPLACYWGAVRVQELKADDRYSEAMFLRACRLGVMSGCTNRAAGILSRESGRPERIQCAARTFEATCRHDDAWGCTMLGLCLIHAKGIEQDLPRAREVLNKGCKHGADDPACSSALELLRQLDEQPR
jgi:hypothetical protein